MDEALTILSYQARNSWMMTIVLAFIFSVGVVASVMTFRYGKKNPRKENLAKWKVYPLTVIAFLFFLLCLFDSAIPTQKAADEADIAVVEGLYVGRPSGGKWGGIKIAIQLEDGTVRRFSTPRSFPTEDSYYHTADHFPYLSPSPQKVRVYYLEHSGKALYMEVLD